MKRSQGGDKLIVKSAKEEHLVLDHWAAQAEPAKLIVQARHLSKVLESFFIVIQRIQHRVVLVTGILPPQ